MVVERPEIVGCSSRADAIVDVVEVLPKFGYYVVDGVADSFGQDVVAVEPFVAWATIFADLVRIAF